MLKIRFKNNKYNAVWLVEPKVTIGRIITNDLVVDDAYVADSHVEVLVEHEQLTLKNLVPEKPVKINGTDVSIMCTLKPDDVITLGQVELQVVDPKRESRNVTVDSNNVTQLRTTTSKTTGWALKGNHTALASRVFPIKESTLVGRAPECDISLAAAHLSRRHAQLQVMDGLLYVKDLGSANGTFLNGKQVTEARVQRGDELRFDALSFGVIGPADDLAKTTVRSAPKVTAKTASTAPRAAIKPRVAPTKNSIVRSEISPRVSVHAKPSKINVEAPPQHGKKGLAILIVIAVIVVAALYITRR